MLVYDDDDDDDECTFIYLQMIPFLHGYRLGLGLPVCLPLQKVLVCQTLLGVLVVHELPSVHQFQIHPKFK